MTAATPDPASGLPGFVPRLRSIVAGRPRALALVVALGLGALSMSALLPDQGSTPEPAPPLSAESETGGPVSALETGTVPGSAIAMGDVTAASATPVVAVATPRPSPTATMQLAVAPTPTAEPAPTPSPTPEPGPTTAAEAGPPAAPEVPLSTGGEAELQATASEAALQATTTAALLQVTATAAALQATVTAADELHPYPDQPATDGPLFPLAVMIENSPDARPQSGLAAADVIYEALTEGGISRFMAVYVDGKAASIGPVRSARHYFVYLAAEFNASLVHIGSSPLGYQMLRSLGLRNLDETYGHPGFQRIRARLAPHNAYTSTDAARAALRQERGESGPGSWAGLRFREVDQPADETTDRREARELAIRYQPWEYTVRFAYDQASNRYLRSMDGAPHREGGNGPQLAAANVVVMTIPSRATDEAGRLELEQIGHGKALFLLDGKRVEGTWSKASETAPTRFRDPAGRPILLNRGQTWVQIVPTEATVTLSPE
jgi:hypothetical protein